MKILLTAINAKYIHTNPAVRMLCRYAGQKGIKAEFTEYTINNYVDEIVNGIYEIKPDFLGFSCYIWNIEMVEKICTLMKKLLPQVKIMLGGPEVSYNSEEVIRKIPCDFIIRGAGEKAFVQLVKSLESEDFSKVSALTYMENGEVKSNPVTEIVEMDEVPFPYESFEGMENKICYYEASRGCPFNCQYCLSSIDKCVRIASFEKVRAELQIFLDAKVRQVKFVDRTFNCRNSHAVEIVKFLKANDNGVTNFHFEVAPELLTDEFMNLLSTARAGLFQLEIGVQSTNEDTLKAVKRHNDFNYIAKCVERIKKPENCHCHLDLIAGLPLEDLKSFQRSFNMVHSLFPHQLQLGFLKILHGAGMEKMCGEYGIEYSPYPPYEVLKTNALSFDDVLYLKGVENMVEIYYNSNRFVNTLNFLLEYYKGDYFTFYAQLGQAAKKLPAQNTLNNKNFQYEFLIAFAKEKGFDDLKTEMLCKLDFILRERPRSSPLWAKRCPNGFDKNDIHRLLIAENKILPLLNESCSPKEIQGDIHVERFPQPPFNDGKCDFIFDYRKRDLYSNAKIIYLVRS